MTEKRAELLLAAVISARATSFVFNKMVLGTLGAFDLLACRFLLAFILLALIAACCFETPRLPQTGMEWGMVLALAIVCTGFGFTLQPVAQSHTSAERAGLFCALSPACATLFGAVLLHEKITLLGAAGILLILSSLLLPHLMKGKKSHEI